MKKNIFIILFSILTLINISIFFSSDEHSDEHTLEYTKKDLIKEEFKFNESDEYDWNIFCPELLKIDSLKSKEFKELIDIENLTDYLLKNNMSDIRIS